MDLKDNIIEIQKAIRTGQFTNEAAVSQGIIMRILQSLDWPIFEAKVVWPEYPLKSLFVDYALCHPPEKPAVIIEVKYIGKLRDADTKLFEYAFHAGVPMAVLTDGQEWNFYLPAERGTYDERRLYKIDLLEREIDEIVNRFTRYLSYEKVCSGESIKAAREDYNYVTKAREINEYLPKAWLKLVEEQDSILIDLISEKVADLCGYKPENDIVSNFLTEQITVIGEKGSTIVNNYPININNDTSSPSIISYGFELKGQKYDANSAIDVLFKVMQKFSSLDPTFLTRFASRRHGRTRRYIARTREELYPGRKDLAGHSKQLSSDWWIGTNYNKPVIRKIIEMACEVAGINFGHDLIAYIGNE